MIAYGRFEQPGRRWGGLFVSIGVSAAQPAMRRKAAVSSLAMDRGKAKGGAASQQPGCRPLQQVDRSSARRRTATTTAGSSAFCRASNEDLGAIMVSEGVAWAFVRYSFDYVGQEAKAKDEQLGVHVPLCSDSRDCSVVTEHRS